MSQMRVPQSIPKLIKASATTATWAAAIVNIGGQQYRTTSTLILNLASSGAGGIDTGSVAAYTTYYVYAVVSNGSVAIIASTNTSLPSGFTDAKLIGYLVTNNLSQIGVLPLLASPTIWDSQSFPMVISGSVSAPTLGTTAINQATFRRDGDWMEIHFELSQTSSGTAGSGTYIFGLPGSFTIDSSKSYTGTSGGQGDMGAGQITASAATFFAKVMTFSASSLSLKFIDTSNASGNTNDANSSTTPFSNATTKITFSAKVPITGWSSTTI